MNGVRPRALMALRSHATADASFERQLRVCPAEALNVAASVTSFEGVVWRQRQHRVANYVIGSISQDARGER